MLNELNQYLEILPRRFHDEFLNDVIVDEYSIKNIRKVFDYYLIEIYNELSEKEKMRFNYMVIK